MSELIQKNRSDLPSKKVLFSLGGCCVLALPLEFPHVRWSGLNVRMILRIDLNSPMFGRPLTVPKGRRSGLGKARMDQKPKGMGGTLAWRVKIAGYFDRRP